jgi:hypothetical protein
MLVPDVIANAAGQQYRMRQQDGGKRKGVLTQKTKPAGLVGVQGVKL